MNKILRYFSILVLLYVTGCGPTKNKYNKISSSDLNPVIVEHANLFHQEIEKECATHPYTIYNLAYLDNSLHNKLTYSNLLNFVCLFLEKESIDLKGRGLVEIINESDSVAVFRFKIGGAKKSKDYESRVTVKLPNGSISDYNIYEWEDRYKSALQHK